MSSENVKQVVINMLMAVLGMFVFVVLVVLAAKLVSGVMPVEVNRLDNNCVKIKQGPFEQVECHESYIHPNDPPAPKPDDEDN